MSWVGVFYTVTVGDFWVDIHRHDFVCGCGAEGMAAVVMRCAVCGEEGLEGYFPEN